MTTETMDSKFGKPVISQMDIYDKDPFDDPEEKKKASSLHILKLIILGAVVILVILTQVLRPQGESVDNSLMTKVWCKVNLFCSAEETEAGNVCDCPPLLAMFDEEV
jgi:hypothetical protein